MSIITAGWFLWFLFMIPPFIFMIYAQARVNSAFRKYSKVANMHRVTGAQAAEALLKDSGLDNVRVERIGKKLGDHYDPRHKVLRLSPQVYSTPSVAALGIVAHEIGHAVQDKTGYAFLRLRSALVSVEEYSGASAVLSAAALTYVASFLQAVAQLMYFILLAIGLGRR